MCSMKSSIVTPRCDLLRGVVWLVTLLVSLPAGCWQRPTSPPSSEAEVNWDSVPEKFQPWAQAQCNGDQLRIVERAWRPGMHISPPETVTDANGRTAEIRRRSYYLKAHMVAKDYPRSHLDVYSRDGRPLTEREVESQLRDPRIVTFFGDAAELTLERLASLPAGRLIVVPRSTPKSVKAILAPDDAGAEPLPPGDDSSEPTPAISVPEAAESTQ